MKLSNDFLKNLTVLVISVGGAAYCSRLLYEDFHSKVSVTGLTPAGTLSDRSQTVKRKYGDNLLWESVSLHDTLFWNDSIQTGDGSVAGITLEDGNKIMLGEASLVVLEHDNDKLSLFLKSGQVVVDSSRAKAKASTIKVNGMALEEKQGEKLSLAMDTSKHELTAVQAKADGTADQIMIDQTGHGEHVQPPAILTNPPALSHIFGESKSTPVKFTWQATADNHQTLEIAHDRDFKSMVSQKKDIASGAEINLDPGMYYWRVKVSNKDPKQDTVSEAASFDVIQVTQPTLVSLEKSPIVYQKEMPMVEFNWQGNAAATKYQWQLSDSQDFKNILLTNETTETSYRTSDLKDGHLYWRVAAVYGDRSVASIPSTIDIKKAPEPTPTPDLPLLSPAMTGSANQGEVDLLKNPHLKWEWKQVEGASGYHFKLVKFDQSKEEVLEDETTQDHELSKKDLPDGQYKWMVSAVDKSGRESQPTSADFKVVHGHPLDAPSFDMSEVQ